MEQFLYWAGAILAIGGALAMIWRALTAGLKTGKRWDTFLEDWHGTPARPGRPAVPGVMQRFVDQETRLAALETLTGEIRHEVYPNSGGSLRDAVDLLLKRVSQLEAGGVTVVPTQRHPDFPEWPPPGRTA